MKKGDITCIIAYTIDEIYMIITKYPTYTLNGMKRIEIEFRYTMNLLLIPDSLVAAHMNVLRSWK